MNETDNMQLSDEQMEALDTLWNALWNFLKKAINSLTELIKKYCDDNNITLNEFYDLVIKETVTNED